MVDIELDRASFPEEIVSNPPSQASVQPSETPSECSENHTQQSESEENVSAERLLENSLAEIKEEMESENSLGIVWSHDKHQSHDQPQSHDQRNYPQFDSSREQRIVGNGDVMLSSGAFKELNVIASSPLKNTNPVLTPGRTNQHNR